MRLHYDVKARRPYFQFGVQFYLSRLMLMIMLMTCAERAKAT